MSRISIRVKQEGPVTAIRMISRFLGIPLYAVHAFFVDGLLIDTGFSNGQRGFLKVCDELQGLHTVVNTHHHEDHTGNNFWMIKKYGLVPLAHPNTSSYMRAPFQWMRFYRRFVWGTPHPSETGQVDSEIRTPRFRFLVIPTPGHSDDHICLYEPNEGWLFSGDLFISEQVRYLRKDEDIFAILDSLKRIATLHLKKMFCSFSGSIDRPEEAINKKIEYIENLQREVGEGFIQGLSPREIQWKLLGRGDRFCFVTLGEMCKRNLINAFLRK
ncbi:MAG: MBL fold metallo-hydrolase [Thermodesulfobacteriota bacterium]